MLAGGAAAAPESMKSNRAFTLVELLTVIAIIAILAAVTAVVSGPFIKSAHKVSAMNNMRQLGAGLMTFTGSHDGELPLPGENNPSFGGTMAGDAADYWYNAVPKAAGSRAIAEYTSDASKEFFKKSNPLFVPGATYPPNPNRPLFAIAMNSLLHPADVPTSSVRMANFVAPSRTIVFLETGLPGEKALPGQSASAYRGESRGRPSNLAARYDRPSEKADATSLRESKTNLLFADGHGESLPASDVISASGSAYQPQLNTNGGHGTVSWTMDPETNPTE
jgi:prepilin-type N-terminal cleavage/methylation domain-containing protein/prepilin-type processing-associated H-X9-DG protein